MQKWLPLIIFIVILGFARIIGAFHEIHNFQPLGALFFCGMAMFGVRWIWVPAVAWFLSYPITSVINGHGWDAQMSVVVAGFGAMVGLAYFFRNKSMGMIFIGSLASAVLFYLITNTLSWMLNPAYVKSMSGLWQSLTVGLPGPMTTLEFFRNGFVAQALFSGVFLYAYQAVRSYPQLQEAKAA